MNPACISVPDFTISGVLPPFLGATPIDRALMSPYRTSLVNIAGKLCGSGERRSIFQGLLTYRQQLGAIGLQVGFQWLSGSFLEDIERLERRHPNDVDVVTFCHRPSIMKTDDAAWSDFVTMNRGLFHGPTVKTAFKCDAYFVDLDIEPMAVVNSTRYWFGLFSHRRGGLWKGMLQIPLPLTEDDMDALKVVTA